MSDTLEFLKRNVKDYRGKLELSQEQLAEKASISTSYITDIELGRRHPSLKTLIKLAEALNVETYQLLINPKEISRKTLDDFSELLLKKFTNDIEEVKNSFKEN